jgi:CubicO group peptidase (beta-lactamase class C family)
MNYADVALRTPFTAATRFNLASNAKQFVAVSILQLAERGALSLDDDIRKYVPELDTHERRVSLRDLLRHTSGLSVVGTAEPGQLEREYSRAEMVACGRPAHARNCRRSSPERPSSTATSTSNYWNSSSSASQAIPALPTLRRTSSIRRRCAPREYARVTRAGGAMASDT